MADEKQRGALGDEPAGRGRKPDYKLYRSRPRLLRRRDGAGEDPRGLAALRAPDTPPRHAAEPPRSPRGDRGGRTWRRPSLSRRLSLGRIVKWLLLALLGWVGISAALFMLSAQMQRGELAGEVGPQLDPGPFPLTGANTILVLGSDKRTEGLDEPGSENQRGRADSIMLLRIGGGANAALSIPRDTVVDIPGYGTNKINAAYALGGPALATRTVKDFLGVEVNHVVEVSFANFPQLIDALGGVTYKGPPVLSKINGGRSNGGTTLRLPRGETEINGREALALARTRKNLRNPREDDIARARRQQQLVGAMKDKVTSFETFIRLPWVSWAAPRAVRSDMAGPTLLGVVAASMTGGAAKQQVLKPSGGTTLPDGGAGLVVDDSTRAAAVERFLRG